LNNFPEGINFQDGTAMAGTPMTGTEIMSIRIAVAEDEAASRNILCRLLKALGHQVVHAVADGSELIEICVGDDVDLVVLDLDMPIMDGLATAEVYWNKGIPVVLISGHSDVDELVLEHEPVSSCLRKPASLESLRRAIAEALASK
jgi:CheY-like chemotaxis protein